MSTPISKTPRGEARARPADGAVPRRTSMLGTDRGHLGSRLTARARAALTIVGGAAVLRLVLGVGFANYDTLYALVWGQQLARGENPQYAIPIAPTPHPLIEVLGVLLAPLGPRGATDVIVWVGYLALSACGYLLYRLGSEWFNRPVGALAALILLTRNPILSYGARAYIDIPFLCLMLGAMLVETRRPRAGAPVLLLLALAGLLRPEAWVFSGLYWLYLVAGGRLAIELRARRLRVIGVHAAERPLARSASAGAPDGTASRTPAQLATLALLAISAPLLWVLGDLLVTGDATWSLTHTKETAATLDRITGIANVPQYIPRRIGEILRPAELVGAALGGILSLLWLRERARMGAVVGLIAVLVFAVLAGFGLPIDTRYAFLAAAILCIFCGVGVFGWMLLPARVRRRRAWAFAGMAVLLGILASVPAEYRAVHGQFRNLARQQRIQNDLLALVEDHAIAASCLPVGVPNHAPIPLLALWLQQKPGEIESAQVQRISRGTYVEAANAEVTKDYILDPHEPHPLTPSVPPGFAATGGDRSWLVFKRCP
jgi:hypothetical protein